MSDSSNKRRRPWTTRLNLTLSSILCVACLLAAAGLVLAGFADDRRDSIARLYPHARYFGLFTWEPDAYARVIPEDNIGFDRIPADGDQFPPYTPARISLFVLDWRLYVSLERRRYVRTRYFTPDHLERVPIVHYDWFGISHRSFKSEAFVNNSPPWLFARTDCENFSAPVAY